MKPEHWDAVDARLCDAAPSNDWAEGFALLSKADQQYMVDHRHYWRHLEIEHLFDQFNHEERWWS